YGSAVWSLEDPAQRAIREVRGQQMSNPTDPREKTSGDRPPQNPAEARPSGRKRGGHGAKTAAGPERAILALLSERTISRAARCAGVDESPLRVSFHPIVRQAFSG